MKCDLILLYMMPLIFILFPLQHTKYIYSIAFETSLYKDVNRPDYSYIGHIWRNLILPVGTFG